MEVDKDKKESDKASEAASDKTKETDKTAKDAEAGKKEDVAEKKETPPEPTFEMLSNPARVMRAQVTVYYSLVN